MYGNNLWWRNPLLLVPMAIIWAGLEYLLEECGITKKLALRLPTKMNVINKVIHVVCCFVGILGSLAIYIIIKT